MPSTSFSVAANRTTPFAKLKALWRSESALRSPAAALLPMRAFLGATFLYAGLSKILDRHYLDQASPVGVHAQMVHAAATSPIGGLVALSAHYSTATGLAIAFGEIAVGLGALLGLFTRIAALGGVILAFSFFLTVSWTTRPYYYGADIGFAFAWLPLLIAGDGGICSLTAWLRTKAQCRRTGTAPLGPGAVAPGQDDIERRDLLRVGLVTAAVATAGVSAGSALALTRRSSGTAPIAATPPSESTTTGPSAHPGTGTVIAAAATVAVGSSKKFTTSNGAPAYLLHPQADTFVAFDAACTHQGCPVAFTGAGFRCPCHGSTFDQNGQVTAGPASTPLLTIPVTVVNGHVVTD